MKPTAGRKPVRTITTLGRGLTPQLFLFVVLPLTGLLIILAFGSLLLHSQAMRSLIAERGTRAVHAAADAIDQQLGHRGLAVEALATLADRGTPPEDALDAFDFFRPMLEGGMAIVSPDGEVLATTDDAPDWGEFPLAKLIQASRASGQPEFSTPFPMGVPPDPTLVVVFAGQDRAAAGAFHPASLAASILDDALPPESQAYAWMLDTNGAVLYRHPSVPGQIGPSDRLWSAIEPGAEGVTFTDHLGEEYVVAFSPVTTTGWSLLLEEPWETVDNPLLRQTQAAPLVLIPALILSLVALGFGIRSVVLPLRTLERRAATVGADDVSALEQPVGGIAEIKSLQHTLVQMARRLRTYQDSLRRYAGAVIRSQEDERRRVARELHDDVIQALIALDQQIQMARRSLRTDPSSAQATLNDLRQQTTRLLDGVRRVIRALRPIYLEDLGLPSALETLASDARGLSGLQVMWSLEGEPRRLLPQQEIALYRIAQEALTNVARHARATSVRMGLRFEEHRAVLRVEDDGIGFDLPPDLEGSDHYGLTGMKERTELIGGHLSIETRPGRGTTIVLDLPL